MKNFRKDNVAFVLGMFETGLGVARALGRNGISVYGFDINKDIGFYSRYISAKVCPDPSNDKNNFVEFLIKQSKHFNEKPILFLTSDQFILPVSENYNRLSDFFLINMPALDLLKKITNKYEQYKLALSAGIDVPQTILIKSIDDLNSNIFNIKYPVFIKGLDVSQWRKVFGGSKKGVVCNTQLELKKIAISILEKNVEIIIQELLTGPDSNHYKFCGYIDKNNNLKASFCLSKIRQNPINFGVGCSVKSVIYPELYKIGLKFFKNINFKGVGSAEFKLDTKTNRLKLIELNPRYWQQNSLAEKCGINFPLQQYLDLTNQSIYINYKPESNIKWVNIYSDFNSFLKYRKMGKLNTKNWLKSLKGKKVFSDYANDDLIPALYELRFGLKLLKLPYWLIKHIIFK